MHYKQLHLIKFVFNKFYIRQLFECKPKILYLKDIVKTYHLLLYINTSLSIIFKALKEIKRITTDPNSSKFKTYNRCRILWSLFKFYENRMKT